MHWFEWQTVGLGDGCATVKYTPSEYKPLVKDVNDPAASGAFYS